MANNCKIFTPIEYVKELLDVIGYKDQLYGKSILENSCGDGKILIEVVRRYITFCQSVSMDDEEIKQGLEKDICGIELEHANVIQCKTNLDILAKEFGIKEVSWNIIEGDYLRMQCDRGFHFVIGNPPYIVYRDIEEDRTYLKNNFVSCKDGKFDYYYAFIEKSIMELEENGRMAYIIPYSIYKNVFAENLREYIKAYITKLYDYTYQNKFPGTTTSSTIMLLEKRTTAQFSYIDVVTGKQVEINKSILGKKWKFTETKVLNRKYRFGDYFQVNNTIATLYNKAFVLEEYTTDDKYYLLPDGYKIEAELVKPAVSRKRGKKSHEIAIIFPYYYESGILYHYTEDEFKEKFPQATGHLMRYKENLEKRDADKNAKWFEYGRSQAITKMHREKLVMPSIVSSRVNVTLENEEVIPCAGFFVTKNSEYTLLQAKRLLESQGFYDYLEQSGIFTTGKSRRLTVKDIADFTFEDWE